MKIELSDLATNIEIDFTKLQIEHGIDKIISELIVLDDTKIIK